MSSAPIRWPRTPRVFLARAAIRASARLCPSDRRDTFIEEWEGELWCVVRQPGHMSVTALLSGLLPSALSQRPASKDAARRERFIGVRALTHDLRFALRSGRSSPSYFVVAIGTLAVGIGATATIFTVVDHVLLRPLPYRDPSRLVVLGTVFTGGELGGGLTSTSAPNFLDWKRRTKAFEQMAGVMNWRSFVLYGGREPERVRIAHVSDGLLELVGIQPEMGRGFAPEEYAAGSERVAILSHSLWQRRFGGELSVIGRRIADAEVPFTVIGVMPRALAPPEALWVEQADLWMPVDFRDPEYASRTRRIMRVVARLAPGVSHQRAREELDGLSAALIEAHPEELTFRGSRAEIGIASMRDETLGDVSGRLIVLLGAVGALLLIACANVSSLTLARATGRARELAIRAALGASRARIVRQLVTESVAVALAAGLLGTAASVVGVSALRASAPAGIPRLAEVFVDARILLVSIAVSALAGVIFGLSPLLHASRGNARVTAGPASRRLRNGLVVGETALALVLLAGAGLLMKSFVRLVGVDPGFDGERVIAQSVRLGESYSPEARDAFVRDVIERVESRTGVERASAVMNLPLGDVNWRTGTFAFGADPAEDSTPANIHMAYPGYFETMGIPLRTGRDFTAQDRVGAAQVAIVNESLARYHWPGEDAVGQRLRIGYEDDAPWLTVIGVIGDVHQGGLSEAPPLELYRPYRQAQEPWMQRIHVVAEHRGDESAALTALRDAMWASDERLALDGGGSLDDRLAHSVREPRFYTFLLGGFALAAIVLAAAGIYGTLAFTVESQRREIGIRMALGARARDVVRWVVGSGMRLVGVGALVGLTGAYFASRLLESWLFEVAPTDPATFLVVTSALAAVGGLASYWPARRAAATDPVSTLQAK